MQSKHVKSKHPRHNDERDYLHRKFGNAIKAVRYKSSVNSTWLVSHGDTETVARFYPLSFQKKLPIETWVICELEKLGVATPRLIDVETTGFTTPVLFLSKLPGISLTETSESMSTKSCQTLLADLMQLIDKVATIPVTTIGYLHDPVNTPNIAQYVERCAYDYITIIHKAALLSKRQITTLENCLERLRILLCGRQTRLTYPDLSAGNILVNNDNFSGLIDWEFVMGFEPLYGFGNLLLELIAAPKDRWTNPEFVFEWLPDAQRQEVALLAVLRAAELVSYLPTTKLYSSSTKRDRLRKHRHALNELEKIVES